jgi:hypothetical protein
MIAIGMTTVNTRFTDKKKKPGKKEQGNLLFLRILSIGFIFLFLLLFTVNPFFF